MTAASGATRVRSTAAGGGVFALQLTSLRSVDSRGGRPYMSSVFTEIPSLRLKNGCAQDDSGGVAFAARLKPCPDTKLLGARSTTLRSTTFGSTNFRSATFLGNGKGSGQACPLHTCDLALPATELRSVDSRGRLSPHILSLIIWRRSSRRILWR